MVVPPLVTSERCHEIVEELRGTCKSIHEVCTVDETNSGPVNDAIDEEIFECSLCGWWCEHNEASEHAPPDEPFCTDCED